MWAAVGACVWIENFFGADRRSMDGFMCMLCLVLYNSEYFLFAAQILNIVVPVSVVFTFYMQFVSYRRVDARTRQKNIRNMGCMLLIALCVMQLKMHSSILFHRRANNYLLTLLQVLFLSRLCCLCCRSLLLALFWPECVGVYTENAVRWKIQGAT